MIFEKLSTVLLTPAELAQTVTDYLQALPETEGMDPMIARLKTVLSKDLSALNTAIVAVRTNELVDEVFEADALRDDDFLTFKNMVDVNKRKKDAEIQSAYRLIWAVIEKAGAKLYRLGYSEESGKLNALFEELDHADKQVAMEVLNVKSFYDDLKASQAEFETIFQAKLDKDLTLKYPTLRAAKAKVVPHLTTLMGVLELLAEEADVYAQSRVPVFNAITASRMTTVKGRKTRNNNEEETPET